MTHKLISSLLCIIMTFANLPVFATEIMLSSETGSMPQTSITIPADSTLYVGEKGRTHFVSFTEHLPKSVEINGDTSTYYFELENNKFYNYRITGEEHITCGGKFKNTDNLAFEITDDMLSSDDKTKSTIDRDTASNNRYNVADIYLNINPKGYLKLAENETFQIVNLRNWEAVDNITGNYFIEPDYHYTVIDEYGNESDDIITVSDSGLITAVGSGTAFVLVTYDAINLDFGSGAEFYGAIWPENTGVFVVSVGSDAADITSNMTLNKGKNSNTIKLSGDSIDAEHDVIYYIGDNGSYTFTPQTDCSVFVANPIVDNTLTYNGFNEVLPNDDGSFSVPLTEGRNVVKLNTTDATDYQVITAKEVEISINNGESVHPGDTLNIVFDTLYHPSNKLAGVYNMTAMPMYTNVSGYEGKIIGSAVAQYNFANSTDTQTVNNIVQMNTSPWGSVSFREEASLTVPADFAYDTFTLSGGMIFVSGFGDAYGNHRGITLTSGKAPNLTAEARLGYLGSLPDINIPVVATSAELESITLDTTNVKTNYFTNEKFDASNLVVTANYSDGASQIATNYSIYPEILTADTDAVTITYRGMTAQIPVSVVTPEVTAIEITNAPSDTDYTAGESFNPTGMVVKAVYNNGTNKETTDYSYAPNRDLIQSDTEITVTYTGTDAATEVASATTPITVAPPSEVGAGAPSKYVTVYFSLYGDENHGQSDEVHTMKSESLDLWLDSVAVTLKSGSKVIDAITKALSNAGIPYTNSGGNYISSIYGLAEFDNGPYSGWMYSLNGRHPNLGVSEQTLSDDDEIIFHYTDNYTLEKNYVAGSPTGTSVTDKKNNNESAYDKGNIKNITTKTADYIQSTIPEPQVAAVGGEWAVLGLARSGVDIPDEYFRTYYNNAEKYIRNCNGILDERKYTEYSRVVIALSSIGADATNIAGYNLITPLLDFEKTVWQGLNGPIWALIALDSADYQDSQIRSKYISYLLEHELSGGGWALSETQKTPDADITAMAITALSRYRDNQNVASAINRALDRLSAMQNKNGGFTSYDSGNAESCAQALVAISSMGIPYTDPMFVKNGKTLLDSLLSFYTDEKGFSHTKGGEINLMSTEQALYALAAVKRASNNESSLFDMSDCIRIKMPESDTKATNSAINIPDIISPKTFDDISEHKNKPAIEKLAARGIINGMTDNLFCPDNTMTRAEFACMTVRALGLKANAGTVFDDVNTNDWFSEFVNAAYSYGIVNGISETEFNPGGTITKEEAGVMVARAAKLCGMNINPDHNYSRDILAPFTDYITVSDWAFAPIAFCYSENILDANETEIMPKSFITRAAVAQMLCNMLEVAELI